MAFRWNDWNLDHVPRHGVTPEEAEALVRNARSPFPQYCGDGRWIVWGQGPNGRFLQAVFLIDDDGTNYIIHARPLTERERKRLRRRQR